MTVVIGTAGHIDHGKTTLLRALTGIDADRLPEERRRGMTIDVGYAYLTLPDGTALDFVDVPGHDRLVGNMLVGAGEIDAAMLVVAADDGPRAQTVEHLALLDALGVRHGIAVVTKVDLAGDERTAEVVGLVAGLLRDTSLAGAPVLAVSSVDGAGSDALRSALTGVRDRVTGEIGSVPAAHRRLAIDRVFVVKGRGVVVTGTLRGGSLTRGTTLRLVSGDRPVRVREVQVHGETVETAEPGRTALNLAGIDAHELRRGLVLTDDPSVVASDRLLVRLGLPLRDRTRVRVHLGTAATDASVSRSGRDALDLADGSFGAVVRLAEPLAVTVGDRAVLRRASGPDPIVGVVILDATPPRGISRRRQSSGRVGTLAAAVDVGAGTATARLDLHGATASNDGTVTVAHDVASATEDTVLAEVASGTTLVRARAEATRSLRRRVTIGRSAAEAVGTLIVDGLIARGELVRVGAEVAPPGSDSLAAPDLDPALVASMDRLERALAVPAPPGLAEAARVAGCPPDGVHRLERDGRIVVLEPDLAYATSTYGQLSSRALDLAAAAPLTPAAFRDDTGTSRKYVMAILADLDRRGVLRRTADGHVPGPRSSS
jgi:selenocysteine-specific elongation factor